MSDRHKRAAHRRPDPPVTSPEESRTRVLSLIASGKTREALDLAKQCFKEAGSAEAEGLVIDAYEARIRAMLAQDLYDEATALAALVGERFPAHRQRVVPLVSQSKAIAGGDLRGLLADLAGAAPPRRQEIETILMRELRDPRQLADAEALAADDPLRRAARAVSDLFIAVTSGPLPAGALGALDQVPRHSALAPWKLLIRALDAYYRRADGAALANLDAIPAHAAPARLVPVLRHLLGGTGATDKRSRATGALIKAVGGTRTALRPAAAAPRPRARGEGSGDGPRRGRADHGPARSRAGGDQATLRGHAALALVSAPPESQGPDRGAAPGPARPRMAARDVPADRAHVRARRPVGRGAPLLGQLPRGSHPRRRPARDRARAVSRSAAHGRAVPGGSRGSARRVRCRYGGGARCADPGRRAARAASTAAFSSPARGRPIPIRACFRALVAHWEGRDPRQAEAHAEAWRHAHPRDLEPLLHLVRAAERRGAHRRALELLDEAEAIDRVHPEVRQSRFRLLLASAERRIREGRFAAALTDLDRLEKEAGAASGDTWLYLGAVRAVATRRNGDGPAAVRLHEEMASRLGTARCSR